MREGVVLKTGRCTMKTARAGVISWNMHRPLLVLLALSHLLQAEGGSRVRYMGGTVAQIPVHSDARVEIESPDELRLTVRHGEYAVSYKSINNLEYGMRVNRRYLEAALISPVLILSKRKQHFLTIGYADRDGKQQAIVLQVSKNDIRPLLVGLEARTGRRVEFQDDEARKAGKG